MRLIITILCAVSALAQNPQTAVFPGAVVGDKELGVQVNRFQTLLNVAIGTTDTTLTLQTTTGLLANTYLGIDFEYMMVCAVVNATTVKIGKSSCPNVDGRALDGTTPAAHLSGKTAAAYLVAGQYNQVAAEVKAIETAMSTATPAAQTPWTSDINGAAHKLVNVSRIGVANSSPAYPMDVVGDINITGTYRVNGTPLPTGGGGTGGAGTVTSVTSPTNTLICANPTGAVTCDANYAFLVGTAHDNDMPGNNNITFNYGARLRPNDPVVGTSTGKLVMYTGSPSTVRTILATTTSGIIGGCTNGCAQSGNARIISFGNFDCAFDGPTTAGHYVQATTSTTAPGSCHDAGATRPTTGQVIGYVTSTNAAPAGGVYTVDLNIVP